MSSPTTTSYWCYRCTRFVTVLTDQNDDVTCPNCESGFVEEIQPNSQSDNPHRRFMYMISNGNGDRTQDSNQIHRFRRARRNAGDRSPFNPVVVLRGAAEDDNEEGGGGGGGGNSYEFYYDDGTGSGLRPVPASMSEFLMGSGFDRLLDQLAQIEVNGLVRSGNPPASKAVVESMPTVAIDETHVVAEEHCAVCKEAFEVGNEVREMPCKHIYHGDCILPWLAVRNSCPVCRHELPVEQPEGENGSEEAAATAEVGSGGGAGVGGGEEEIVGLTIWRLPGGGFAVGRFRGGEREFPGVFTEMDGGGFSSGGTQRRVSWVGRRSRGRNSGGGRDGSGGGRGSGGRLGRVFRGLVSLFRRSSRPSNSVLRRSGSESGSLSSRGFSQSSSSSGSGFGRFVNVRSRRRGLELEIENGTDRW